MLVTGQTSNCFTAWNAIRCGNKTELSFMRWRNRQPYTYLAFQGHWVLVKHPLPVERKYELWLGLVIVDAMRVEEAILQDR